MSNERIFTQENFILPYVLAYGTDAFAGTKLTDVVSIKNCTHVTFLVEVLTSAAGNTAMKPQVTDDFTPSNATDCPFSWRKIVAPNTYTTPAAVAAGDTKTTDVSSVSVYEIDVEVSAARAAALGAATPYEAVGIQLSLVEDTNLPVAGLVNCVLRGMRIQNNAPGTQIA